MKKGSITLVILLLAIVQFTHIVDFMLIMPMGETLMSYFEIDGQKYSYLVAGYPVAAFVVNIGGIFFLDKLNRKTALLIGYLGFTIGTIACGVLPNTDDPTTNYYLFLGARVLTGLFGGILNSQVFSIVGDAVPFEKRATAMSYVMMAFSVASVLGVPLSLLMMNVWGWQMPYVVVGGISILVSFFIMVYLPPVTGHLENSKAQKSYATFLEVIRSKKLSKGLLFMLLMVMGQFTIIPFIAPYMIKNVGFTQEQIFWIYFVGGALTIVTSPFVGRLSDKYGKKKLFFIMASLSTIPLIWVTNLGHVPLPAALAVNALFFVCIGGRMVPANTLMTALVPPQLRGGYMSMNSAVQSLALFLSSIIAGMIVIAKENQPIENYNIMGYIAVGFSICAIFLMTQIEEPKK